MRRPRRVAIAVAVTATLATAVAVATAPAGAQTTTTTPSATTTTTPPTTTAPTTSAPTTSAPQSTYLNRSTPGVYITELPSFGEGLVGISTDVTAFVGAATLTGSAANRPSASIASLTDFGALVTNPSPALSAAVAAFFANGGGTAIVVPTADETAPSLAAALRDVVGSTGANLDVVPAIGSLAPAEHATVASAAGAVADSTGAVAILDPPASVVAQVAATSDPAPLVSLATTLNTTVPWRSTVLLSSSLAATAGGDPTAAAPAVAGLLAANDRSAGVWDPLGAGVALADGVVPAWNPTAAAIGALRDAGVDSLATLPGSGTVVYGNRTLGNNSPYGALTTVRTGNYIFGTITNGLAPDVFAANDGQTWALVTAEVSTFLSGLWQQGGLVGTTASDAFTVQVGLGTSMTSQDVLNGYMVLDLSAQVAPGLPLVRSLRQQMQTS